MDRLEVMVEEDAGPLGTVLTLAAQQTGQTKLNLYVLGLALLLLLTAVLQPGAAGALAVVASLPYPLSTTLRVAEVGSGEEHGVWLLYWILHSAAFAVLPVPVLRLLAALWLQHPVTEGAAFLYHRCLRPFVLLQHGILHLPAFAALHPALLSLLGLRAEALAGADAGRVQAAADAAAPSLPLRLQASTDAKPRAQSGQSPVSLVTAPSRFQELSHAAVGALNSGIAV